MSKEGKEVKKLENYVGRMEIIEASALCVGRIIEVHRVT